MYLEYIISDLLAKKSILKLTGWIHFETPRCMEQKCAGVKVYRSSEEKLVA